MITINEFVRPLFERIKLKAREREREREKERKRKQEREARPRSSPVKSNKYVNKSCTEVNSIQRRNEAKVSNIPEWRIKQS
jgi:hypothetical protein